MKKKIFISNLLLMFFVFPAFAAQNIKIEIPEIIYTAEDNFRLGQFAKISGGNRTTRNILSDIIVFSDGDKLLRSEVLNAISESDAADARIELYMPSFTKIERPYYEGNFTETSQKRNQNRSRIKAVQNSQPVKLKRGRQVKILARIGALRATIDGILMDSGTVGEWVRVRRKDDKKTVLKAKILNENFVEVNVE